MGSPSRPPSCHRNASLLAHQRFARGTLPSSTAVVVLRRRFFPKEIGLRRGRRPISVGSFGCRVAGPSRANGSRHRTGPLRPIARLAGRRRPASLHRRHRSARLLLSNSAQDSVPIPSWPDVTPIPSLRLHRAGFAAFLNSPLVRSIIATFGTMGLLPAHSTPRKRGSIPDSSRLWLIVTEST